MIRETTNFSVMQRQSLLLQFCCCFVNGVYDFRVGRFGVWDEEGGTQRPDGP